MWTETELQLILPLENVIQEINWSESTNAINIRHLDSQ